YGKPWANISSKSPDGSHEASSSLHRRHADLCLYASCYTTAPIRRKFSRKLTARHRQQRIQTNVDDYGAGDAGGGDDTERCLQLLRQDRSVFLVPDGKAYLLMPVTFRGPCRVVSITVMLEAPSNRSVWLDHNLQEWITFEGIDRLRVLGGGTLNGNGLQRWINSCKLNKSILAMRHRPDGIPSPDPENFQLMRCTHLVVEELQVRDSMQMHVAIAYSWNVVVSKLLITAPGWSPNTDGIHVSNSREALLVHITLCVRDK
ncbi:hypothetical protein U9M48_030214, partial [Paspalum notatum var. saurae]